MSGHDGWKWQGRQYHQWFGHGTKPSGGSGEQVGTLDDRIRNLTYTAVASIPAGKRFHRNASFDDDSRKQFLAAMREWIGGADLPLSRFAAHFFDASASAPGVADLLKAALLTRDAQSLSDIHAANDALALGMLAVGLDFWPRFLTMASKRANAQSSVQLAAANRQTPYYGPNSPIWPGSPANEEAVRAAEELIRATRQKIQELLRGSEDQPAPPPGINDPLENKPPRDAKDPEGAKAPGKPGEAEGFEDPKGGERWVKEPNGERRGWLHKDGSVWVPTGPKSESGQNLPHGGPHWDVQYPDGSYRNVRPPPPAT